MNAPRIFAFVTALVLSAAIAAAPHAALALGSTPVTVTNPSVPVTVGNPDDPAAFAKAQGIQHPFQMSLVCKTLVANFVCSSNFDLSVHFPNQRLIIEYAEVQCTIAADGPLVLAEFETMVSGDGSGHTLPIVDHIGAPASLGSGNLVVLGQVVHVYADANTAIIFNAETSGSAPPVCTFTLNGQAIDP